MRVGHARRGDRGVFLLVFALCLFAILMIVAFAVDLGQARFSKRNEQAVADLAALDAGYYLSGRGGAATPVSQPAEACIAAAQSVVRNVEDFRPAPTSGEITTECGLKMPAVASACDPAGPKDAQFVAGRYVLTIRYPVPTSELDTAGFAGSGTNDGTDPCERMRVTLRKTDATSFAAVGGYDELSTVADSVVRANTDDDDGEVAALLLLERIGCEALQTSGGGLTGSGVVVQWSDADTPGIIAADSAGQRPPCSNTNTEGGWVIYGTSLPAASGGGPSITAEPTPSGELGIIATYATSVGGRDGYTAPTGLNVAPSKGTINSRQLTDDRYIVAGNQIPTLHNTASTATASVPSSPPWAVVTGTECGGNVDAADLVAELVFVDCPTFSPNLNVFVKAIDFYVRGNIEVKGNKVLSLPVVERFYVRGCSVGGCSGGNEFAVDVANNGSLLINTGQLVLPGTVTCASRNGPGYQDPVTGIAGQVRNTTKFATLGGEFSIAGLVRMCQTTLYLGDGAGSVYDPMQYKVTSGGLAPENYPAIAQCGPTLPCPKNSAATGSFISFAGSGAADWSAPNQLSTRPLPADLVYNMNPFEDLALWSESSTSSDIKGQGNNSTRGVFFLPNATFTFRGQGTQTQPLNAQFFVRRMNVSGQGSLFMKPNPADSLTVDVAGDIALIR